MVQFRSSVNPGVRAVVRYFDDCREYRVRIYIDDKAQPDADYFTDNHKDAITTAQIMLRDYKK